MKGWLNHSARTCPVPAADGDAQHAAADAGAPLVDVFDHAADALELAFFELVDVALVGEVLVIAGEEEEHVADGVQPEPIEQFRPAGPTPLRNWTGVASCSGGGRAGFGGGHAAILKGAAAGGQRPAKHPRAPSTWGH